MEDNSRKDIRRLLKTFGIRADEAMVAYLARHPELEALPVRITLESMPAGDHSSDPLHLEIEDTITRA